MTTKRNPHGALIAIDPPRSHPPRRWKCHYCGLVGLMDEVQKVACTHVYPSCEHCGQSGECAADCAGIMAILGSPNVKVIGGIDRYSAAGMPLPDPKTVCKGDCEGMGFFPSNDKKEWPPGAVPDEIGYVFVKCTTCGGTGRSKAST